MTICYLAPGVYVEETDAPPRPIQGVPTSTAPFTRVYLVGALMHPRPSAGEAWPDEMHRALHEWERVTGGAHSPDWTDRNASDVGVTMVELLAYFAEALLAWRGARPATMVPAAARLATASLALVSGRERPSPGELNAVASLSSGPIGQGIVEGLGVATGEEGLKIVPGVALDRLGREIDATGEATEARSDTAVRRKRDP